MASTLYLNRENGKFYPYTGVDGLTVTGAQTTYAGVTGVAATDIITITGAVPVLGQSLTFTSITGGTGLSAGVQYWVISPTGATCQVSRTQGGTAVDFTTAITAASVILQNDEIRVWSGEYRDIFVPNGVFQTTSGGTNGEPLALGSSYLITDPVVYTAGNSGGAPPTVPTVVASLLAATPDDAAHVPLRQTKLPRTYWRFDMGAVVPKYLYAEVQSGDTISNNPPNLAVEA